MRQRREKIVVPDLNQRRIPFGCDALDVISMSESLPADLELGELLYSPNIGAYSHASSTHFNGFPPAKVVHVNRSHMTVNAVPEDGQCQRTTVR
jgi:hypothetical protein